MGGWKVTARQTSEGLLMLAWEQEKMDCEGEKILGTHIQENSAHIHRLLLMLHSNQCPCI